MMKDFESITAYLEPELIRLLDVFASQNRVTNTQAIELVLRTFFSDNDIINQMINQDDLEKRMNDLENKLLKLAKTTHCQAKTIEKLERQIAELEDVLEKVSTTAE